MNVKYQVFISSTYTDLVEERDQVIKAVLEMGHIPVGMEMFSAGDEQQWKIIQRQIDDCDYYVLIVAHRYGSIDNNISYTEKEYDYAVKKGIPTLGFVIDNKASWPADKIENDTLKKTKLANFKEKVKKKLIGFWSNKEDLYAKVSIALMKQFTSNPQEGWVKAGKAISPEITQEISRLSGENARLRKEIAQIKEEKEEDGKSKLEETVAILENKDCKLFYFYSDAEDWSEPQKVKLKRIFDIIAPEIIIENTTEDLAHLIGLTTKPEQERNIRRNYPIPSNQIKFHLGDLQALGLIEPSKLKHSVNDNKNYWTLSEYGKEVHRELRLRKIKKSLENLEASEEE